MAWISLLLALSSAVDTGVDVDLELTDGSTQSGRLVSLTTDQVSIIRDEQPLNVPVTGLRRVRFPAFALPLESTQEAILTDGSRLRIQSYQVADGQATLRWMDDSTQLIVPRRSLSAVRLMDLNEDSRRAWDSIVANRPKRDVVVIRRKDGRLQQIAGTLGDINESQVRFQFDEDWIEVRRNRVAGVLYTAVSVPRAGVSRGQMELTDHSELQLLALQHHGDQLQITTPNETSMTIPLARVLHIDFVATSTVFLSDIEPETTRVSPFVRVPALADAEQQWFRPQTDRRLSHEPLSLLIDGTQRTFDKGLGLHSHTELTYRLAGKYRRFLAVAAVDDTGGPGRLTLVISTDGREVYRQTLAVGEPPVTVDIDVTSANRMQIVVDYDDQSDLGDQISLCDARFIK